jgi:N4-gp56 family major capsid protein
MATATVAGGSFNSDLVSEPGVTQAYYSKKLLTRAKYRNYHARWAASADLPSKEGKTVVMRRWLHLALALSPLTEGVPPSGKVPSLDDYQASLVQHGDFIALSDFAQWTMKDPILQHWTMLLGEQEGYTIDAVDRDTAIAGTNVIYSNGSQRTDLNSIVDFNDLDRAIRVLTNEAAEKMLSGNSSNSSFNSYPIMPAYPAITVPDVIFDLQNIEGYKWASEYKGAADGEVGRYKQIAFFEAPDPSGLNAGGKKFAGGGATSSLVKNTTGTADVYTILIFGQNGFTKVPLNGKSSSFISKPLGSAGTADPLDQVATIGWKTVGARLITNQDWLCRIECCASL